MPNPALTAFLRQIAHDENLRHALVGLAAQHGFRFAVRDLDDVDFRSLVTGAASEEPDDGDEETDPGFGIGEFPD